MIKRKKAKVIKRPETWGIVVRLPKSKAMKIKQVIAADSDHHCYSLEVVRVIRLFSYT